MKYGFTPLELIKELRSVTLSDEQKEEALKDLKMYFGEPPINKEFLEKRLSSGLLEVQILAKYFMIVKELMVEVGYKIAYKAKKRRGTYREKMCPSFYLMLIYLCHYIVDFFSCANFLLFYYSHS